MISIQNAPRPTHKCSSFTFTFFSPELTHILMAHTTWKTGHARCMYYHHVCDAAAASIGVPSSSVPPYRSYTSNNIPPLSLLPHHPDPRIGMSPFTLTLVHCLALGSSRRIRALLHRSFLSFLSFRESTLSVMLDRSLLSGSLFEGSGPSEPSSPSPPWVTIAMAGGSGLGIWMLPRTW